MQEMKIATEMMTLKKTPVYKEKNGNSIIDKRSI